MKVLYTLFCCVIVTSCKVGYLAVNPVIKNQVDYNAKSIYAINSGDQLDIYLVNEIAAPILSLPLDEPFIYSKNCTNQSISNISTQDDQIFIKGDLCGQANFEFQIQYVNNEQIHLDLIVDSLIDHAWNFVWKKAENETILSHESDMIAINNKAMAPYFICSKHKAFSFENPHANLHVNGANYFRLELTQAEISMNIWQKESYKELVSAFNDDKIGIDNLPIWALGTSLILEGGAEKIDTQINRLFQDTCQIDAIVLKDWTGMSALKNGHSHKQYWEIDTTLYPNINAYSQQMELNGIDLLATFSPLIENEGPLYQVAKENNYLVLTKTGGVAMPQGIDFNNNLAMQWYMSLISEATATNGFKGWIAQQGQTHPMNKGALRSFDASKWAEWNAGALDNRESDEYFINETIGKESSKYIGIYKVPTQEASWKHMRAAFAQLLQNSNTGVPIAYMPIWNSADNNEVELQQRMIELAAFLPLYQAEQVAKTENNVTIFDEGLHQHFSKFAHVHEELRGYLDELAIRYQTEGLPMVRHLSLEFPDDPVAFGINEQFMLGSELLVAPVFKKGKKKIQVYLPSGNWEHLFTKQLFAGPSAQWVNVPIGVPAVFRKK